MIVLKWDCGPGCGTTGCGNDPESIRRFNEYREKWTVQRERPPRFPWKWLLRLAAFFVVVYFVWSNLPS